MAGSEPRFSAIPKALIPAFVLLIAMVAGSLALSIALVRDSRRTADTQAYGRAINDVLTSIRDAESGQRGYLLTDDTRYLDAYTNAIDTVEPALDRVRKTEILVPRSVFREIAPHVQLKVAELRRTVRLAEQGQKSESMANVRSDLGLKAMTAARTVLDRERGFVRQRTFDIVANSITLSRWLTAGLLAGMIAIAALMITWSRQTGQQIGALRGASDEAENALASLKAETAALAASEARVRQLQKMQAIGQLTGGIAHDFNNMLAVVMSGIELAQRRLKTKPEEAITFLDASHEAAVRAAALTARLLAFSRNQPLAPRPVDMNALIAGMADMVTRTLTEAVSVETIRAAGLWRCYADAGEIENAILNLAVNARDAMPDGGKLTIETANAHVDERYAALHGDLKYGQYVLVCVTDTGTGMARDVIEKAFDPFFTTKEVGQGTGLGLSQVFGFVKQSGGHVSIYSELGQGTTVKLYLPRYEGTAEPTPIGPDMSETPLAKAAETILVVEDEQRVRELAVEMLSELGYRVIATGSPNEAIRIVRDRDDIALIFTDVVMPEINGKKLAELVIAERPGLPILFTTGYTRNAVVHNRTLDIGVALIAKPYSIRDLALKVHDVLEGRGINRPV